MLLRFGGVEVDAARHRLTIDGRPVRVQRLVFKLLLALCEAKGRVRSRDELVAQLWPEDVIPADESLSQLVFKLRSALGPYGNLVVTVRQVGVRLDAQLELVPIAAPEPPEATVPDDVVAFLEDDTTAAAIVTPAATEAVGVIETIEAAQTNAVAAAEAPDAITAPRADAPAAASLAQTAEASTPRVRSRVLLVAAAALTLAIGLIAHWQSKPVVVSAGFGLDTIDVQVSAAGTVELLQRAFAADADGNQSAARVLMEIAHATDARTPVPAMFLTYWYGGQGHTAAAQRWAAERDRRLGPETPTYIALLARFLDTRGAPVLERFKLESLLLERHPDAALIRYAHAHYHLQRNERAAALGQLRQIDLRAVGRRRAPMVVGDLASLGDLAAAERSLSSAGDALDASGRAYAQARI